MDRRTRALALLTLALALLLAGLPARAQAPSRHLALGNPSGAAADPAQPANYLIARDQYALSYHRDRGIPTWVAWHLQASDLGDAPRYSGNFFPDTSLPDGWYRVTHADYTGTGYDRGHMTPSADRTATTADNEATFILTNVIPQAPENNQGLWAQLEAYARDLVAAGNELYIVSGGAGSLGTLADGKLTIPASVWKVILVLPAADGDDAARVAAETQALAVWTPNDASVAGKSWQAYTTTIRCVEQRTGLDFFAAAPDAAEAAVEGAPCPEEAPAATILLPLVGARPAVAPAPAAVTIAEIVYNPDGDDVQGEYVLLRNDGAGPAAMAGWTLRDAATPPIVYTFPAFTLAPGAEVRLWVKAGADDAANLYWGRAQPVWNNTGDTATLRDADGAIIATFSYPAP
jgi:endonuclease G